MQYDIPQFIEEESKIIGPLSLRQFFLFLGGGVFSFMLYFVFQTWLWIMIAGVIMIGITFLSFGRIQGRPASTILVHSLKFFWQPRLYIWKKKEMKAAEFFEEKPLAKSQAQVAAKKPKTSQPMTPEKIKEIARQLDIHKSG